MATVELCNLSLGTNDRVPERFRSGKVGPFTVSLVPQYSERQALLARSPGKEMTVTATEEGMLRQWRDTPGQVGQWVVTAIAEYEPAGEKSLFLDEPESDEGIWDLCEILTFVSGRRVCVAGEQSRYGLPGPAHAGAALEVEGIAAAAIAWQNRQALVAKGIDRALTLLNLASDSNLLQASGVLVCAATNVLYDKEGRSAEAQPLKPVMGDLRARLSSSVREAPFLSDEQKRIANVIIGSALDRGVSPKREQLKTMLNRYGALPDPMTAAAEGRLKYVNDVRDALVHRGRLPRLTRCTPETSCEYTVAIVFNILPSIVRLVLGNALGFKLNGVGSLSLYTDPIKRFFSEGTIRRWKIDDETFEQYFASLGSDDRWF